MQALFLMITVTVLVAILAADVRDGRSSTRARGTAMTRRPSPTRSSRAAQTVGSGPRDQATGGGRRRPLARGRAQQEGAGRARAAASSSSCSRSFPGRSPRTDPTARDLPAGARALVHALVRHDGLRPGRPLPADLGDAPVGRDRLRRGRARDRDRRHRRRLGRLPRRHAGRGPLADHRRDPGDPDLPADHRHRRVPEELGPVHADRSCSASLGWSYGARQLRAQTLSLRTRETSSRRRASAASGSRYMIVYEILPTMTSLIVASFLGAALYAVLFAAGLQFIGLGDPNSQSWGTMLYWAENNEALGAGMVLWAIMPGRLHRAARRGVRAAQLRLRRDQQPGAAPAEARPQARPPTRAGAGARRPPRALLEVARPLRRVRLRRGPGGRGGRRRPSRSRRGEFLGIVGESGCGKSTLLYAITRLLGPPLGGEITRRPGDLQRPRHGHARRAASCATSAGASYSVVMQSAMNALNPVLTVARADAGRAARRTRTCRRRRSRRAPRRCCGSSRIDPIHLHSYPHQLSGGMRQRAMIAMALLFTPDLVDHGRADVRARRRRAALAHGADQGAAASGSASRSSSSRTTCRSSATSPTGCSSCTPRRCPSSGRRGQVFEKPRHPVHAGAARRLPLDPRRRRWTCSASRARRPTCANRPPAAASRPAVRTQPSAAGSRRRWWTSRASSCAASSTRTASPEAAADHVRESADERAAAPHRGPDPPLQGRRSSSRGDVLHAVDDVDLDHRPAVRSSRSSARAGAARARSRGCWRACTSRPRARSTSRGSR